MYPLVMGEGDPRFTLGLLSDVVRVLEAHGYPPERGGLELVNTTQASEVHQPAPVVGSW
jgi:hypothetical protein